ncbi:MAG: flagellar motor switch protein FliG [Candidatus Eisenbacteria bacterium]|nr:flagellar motor switch protein FliG [Candidatus Eisenbacteria bacterium]
MAGAGTATGSAGGGGGGKATARSLTGAQKCAIVCMALADEEGSELLRQLSPEQLEIVLREMATLPVVPEKVVQDVLREYREKVKAPEMTRAEGPEAAQKLLSQAFGADTAKALWARVREQVEENGIARLKTAAPETLLSIVRGEHPQTAALILAHLESKAAFEVLKRMDVTLAGDILYRMARIDRVSPEVLSLVETTLRSKTDLTLATGLAPGGGPAAVAKVLNLSGDDLQPQLLDSIQDRNPELAASVRALMFTFEDLLSVDGKGIQKLLREIDTKEFALALKVASEELKAHIKANMSERAGEALEEEIELLGPVRVKDVEASHARIIEVARRLESDGEIVVQRESGGDDIVV